MNVTFHGHYIITDLDYIHLFIFKCRFLLGTKYLPELTPSSMKLIFPPPIPLSIAQIVSSRPTSEMPFSYIKTKDFYFFKAIGRESLYYITPQTLLGVYLYQTQCTLRIPYNRKSSFYDLL